MQEKDWKIARMERACALALQGQGFSHPNPRVGAVLSLPNGEILGEGFYQGYNQAHAEQIALSHWEEVPKEAVLFVTLEPCSVRKKGETCTQLLLRKKVRHVVYGCLDQNPDHQGLGLKILQEKQVKVELSAMHKKCEELNEVFFFHSCQKKTYLALKAAISLDGKIALADGASKWITSKESRMRGNRLRNFYQSLAVGGGTLRSDNPQMSARFETHGYQPIKIVWSVSANLPMGSHFCQDSSTKRILICGAKALKKNILALQNQGIEILQSEKEFPSFEDSLSALYQKGVVAILLEGGAKMHTLAVKDNRVQKYHIFLAPKILGAQAKPFVQDLPFPNIEDSLGTITALEKSGPDLYLEITAASTFR